MNGNGVIRMAQYEFVGFDAYMRQLDQLGQSTTGLCKRSIYDGAAVVADAVRAEVSALPVTDRNEDPQGVFEYERDGLLDGLGIAKIKDRDGVVSTRIDFDGYNRMRSKKYPQGHPNSMIARAINAGTSKRAKNPFMKRAINKSKSTALNAMSARMDADINEIMKG